MSTTTLTITVAVLAAIVVVLGIVVYLLWREVSQMRIESGTARSVAEALRDGRDEDAVRELMEYLESAHERMAALAEHARTTDETLEHFRERAKSNFQRIGVVRFDASDDVSGGLSCALCVLDAHSNGFLVTTLYDLSHSRTFVRAIRAGKADRELLPEEADAVDAAVSGAGLPPPRERPSENASRSARPEPGAEEEPEDA